MFTIQLQPRKNKVKEVKRAWKLLSDLNFRFLTNQTHCVFINMHMI